MRRREVARYGSISQAVPQPVRRRALAAYERFSRNPDQRGLQFKLINARHAIWSARVSDDYRVLGKREGERIYWFWIGPHREYDQLLRRLSR